MTLNLAEERHQPGQRRLASPALFQTRRCNRRARHSRTSSLRILARNLAQTQRRIGHSHVRAGSRRRAPSSGCLPNARSPAAASADRLRSETFSARAASPSSVAARQIAFRLVPSVDGVTKLPNARETDVASEVPADHPETRGAAIHLVDLFDVWICGCAVLPFGRDRPLPRRRFAVFRC